MNAKSPVWVRRRSSAASSVSDHPRREGVLENTRSIWERANERACERERMTGCLRAAAASAVCVELVFSDAELWQCYRPTAPFRKDLPVFHRACSVVHVTPTRIHERNSSSHQASKLKRTRQQAATASRQRAQLRSNRKSEKERGSRSTACALFSEYVTACISLDLSVFHCDCVTVEGGFRWGSNPPEHVFSPNLILYFPWTNKKPKMATRKSEQKAPATLQKLRHNIHAHNIAYATRIKFSFSTMHFQQSAQRTRKMGLGEVKRRKDRQKERETQMRSPWREIKSLKEAETELCIAVTSADFFLFATRFFGISRSEWAGYM